MPACPCLSRWSWLARYRSPARSTVVFSCQRCSPLSLGAARLCYTVILSVTCTLPMTTIRFPQPHLHSLHTTTPPFASHSHTSIRVTQSHLHSRHTTTHPLSSHCPTIRITYVVTHCHFFTLTPTVPQFASHSHTSIVIALSHTVVHNSLLWRVLMGIIYCSK